MAERSGTRELTNVGRSSKIAVVKVLPPTEERVAIVRKAMADLVWCRRLAKQLQAQWGCSMRVVENAAAEASRQLAQVGDAQRDRTRVEVWLEAGDLCAQRLAQRGELTQAGHLYVKLATTLATVAGLNRQRLVLEGAGGTDAVLAGIGGEEP